MIHGQISPSLDLIVPVYVLDQNDHAHRLEAAVDTGFTGDLTLPPDRIRRLGLVPGESIDLTMANDATESFATYYGSVLWRGARIEIQVVEAAGTPLIGMSLLLGNLLTAAIDYGGAITISPLSDAAAR